MGKVVNRVASKEPRGKKNPPRKARKVAENPPKVAGKTRKAAGKPNNARTATAAPPPGTFLDQSDDELANQPRNIKKARKVRSDRGQEKNLRKSLAAPPPGTFEDESDCESSTEPAAKKAKSETALDDEDEDSDDSESDSDESETGSESNSDGDMALGRNQACGEESGDDDMFVKVKMVPTAYKKLETPRKRPKIHQLTKEQRMDFRGLSDIQINHYLEKTGFKDIGVGYAAMKGNTVVVKSGYIRLLVTPDHKHYAIPNSMTERDWKLINYYRTKLQKRILVFVTREYVMKKFLKKRRGNASIPTDQDIVDNYCSMKKKNKDGEYWEFREAHSALLFIEGNTFRLYDTNNFYGLEKHKPENFFVQEFYDIFKKRAFPHIYRALGLKAADTRDYAIVNCHYSEGVTNSCALYLLFVCEQMAEKRWNFDVFWTPCLTQLFACKVNLYVGGLIGFETFKRNNPDWLTWTPMFLFNPLLSQLKGGDYMTIPKLNEEKERIFNVFSIELDN